VEKSTQEMLTTDRTFQIARDAAKQYSESRLKVAFTSATPQEKWLVQRIDREDSFYYIVSYNVSARETARVIVDAFDGKVGEASGITREDGELPRYLPMSDAMNRLFTESNRSAKWEIKMRSGLIGLHPVLVWKPCVQSSTPFLPFYQFSVGESFVYLRVDGKLSARLTTGPA